MWPNMAEFRSASSAGSWRKKKRKEEESLVKYKSADNYDGRPKISFYYEWYAKAAAYVATLLHK